MKIGIDLRPFSNGSCHRGIGMYTKAFVENLIEKLPDAEFHYLNTYSEYSHILPENNRCILHNYFTGPKVRDWGDKQLFHAPYLETIFEAIAKHFIKHSGINIMIFTNPNDYGNPYKLEWFNNVKTAGILYDLIPLVFSDIFYNDPVFINDYKLSLEFISKLDILFAISESTKKDAVNLLRIPEDKIKVIYAGVSSDYRKIENLDKNIIKHKYNIKKPFIIYAGGVDFRKHVDYITKAFFLLKKEYISNYQFVIVGKIYDDLKNEIIKIAENNNGVDKIIFTGFIPEEDLIVLYNCAEMLVFPSIYEGFGLPIIEAMSCGTRIVTAKNSSLEEIAKDYAVYVDPNSVKSIAKGINYVLEHPIQTKELAEKAVPYAQNFTWKRTAELAIESIINLNLNNIQDLSRNYNFKVTDKLLNNIAKEYIKYNINLNEFEANIICKQLLILEDDLINNYSWSIPRILYDITVVKEWIKNNYKTGITRVSIGLLNNLKRYTNVLTIANEGKDKLEFKLVDENTMNTYGDTIELKPDDIYLMPELQFKGIQVPKTHPNTEYLKENGIKCYAILHDVLPIIMPEYFEKDTVNVIKEYIHEIIQNYDGIIGVSKSTIDDLINYINTNNITLTNSVKLGYSHNGCDNYKTEVFSNVSENVKLFFNNKNIFLMVGTIEPRKGHDFVLNTFEKIWKENNLDISLCIIGHIGWKMEKFINKLNKHPYLNKKLLFLEAAPDSYVEYAYTNSTALIQASVGEGFGLPLIEAGKYGLPVLCSDIPVFHEIAEDNVIYFNRNEQDNLYNYIHVFFKLKESGKLPDSKKIKSLTWKQSAENLFNIIYDKNNRWYAKINKDKTIKYYEKNTVSLSA